MEPVHEIFTLHASNSKKVTKVEPVHEPPILQEGTRKKAGMSKNLEAENNGNMSKKEQMQEMRIRINNIGVNICLKTSGSRSIRDIRNCSIEETESKGILQHALNCFGRDLPYSWQIIVV